MNVDELTLGQIKELQSLLSNQAIEVNTSGDIFKDAIGKYVIVRSRNEGINAGTLVKANMHGCVLKDARRIWYHKPNEYAWYEGVAVSGLADGSKISTAVGEKYIIEDYSITLCESKASDNIKGYKAYVG